MENKMNIKRAYKGNPWTIRNHWFVVQAWDIGLNVENLSFKHAPLWIQIWDLPMHCISVTIGKQLRAQIGEAMDVVVYEFLDSGKPGK
jgi:hypothetical protein